MRHSVRESQGVWPLCGPSVAIVGARDAEAVSLHHAYRLAVLLARAGITVISGGALGIDTEAHWGAIAGGGKTCAVLGSGLGHLYPARNRSLFGAIVRNHGAVVSPFPSSAPPRKFQFIVRNQVVAELASAIVVVEASLASGSLTTAKFGRELGKKIVVFDGSPGCRSLSSWGAISVRNAGHAFDALTHDIAAKPPLSADTFVSEGARAVWAQLDGTRFIGMDELFGKTGQSYPALVWHLWQLEEQKLVVRRGGVLFRRAQASPHSQNTVRK